MNQHQPMQVKMLENKKGMLVINQGAGRIFNSVLDYVFTPLNIIRATCEEKVPKYG